MHDGTKRSLAICFSVLLMTSMVSMSALASSPPNRNEHTTFSSAWTQPGSLATTTAMEPSGPSLTDDHLAPLERLHATTTSLEDLNASSDQERQTVAGGTDKLNASVAAYRDEHRALDRAAFDRQAQALHTLSQLAGNDHDPILHEASQAVFLAGNHTARVAIVDAEDALEAFGDDLDEYRTADVERAIDDAEVAHARAEAAVEAEAEWSGETGDELRRGMQARANAIDHYREANHHAQWALAMMADIVEPEVHASVIEASERNGTVNVGVHAIVVAPRAYTFESIEAHVDSEVIANVSIRARAGGGAVGTGSIVFEVEPDSVVDIDVLAHSDIDGTVSETVTVYADADNVTADPSKSYTVEKTNDDNGVTVTATGDGLRADALTVSDETPASNQSFRAGPMVRIENRTAIANATVTIPLEEGVDPTANLSIFTWDPTTNEPWTPLETTIDADNGTASAAVEHFSYFSVFDVDKWRDLFIAEITLESGGSGAVTLEKTAHDELGPDWLGAPAFEGAGTLDDGRIIFAPSNSDHLGLYDPATRTYTSGPEHGEGYDAFSDVVVLDDGRVVLVPKMSSSVGLFDPADDSYTSGAEHGEGSDAFAAGAQVEDGRVIFAPESSFNVGIYDPANDSFTNGPMASRTILAFASAVAIDDGRVIFVPGDHETVGIFDPSNDTYEDGPEYDRPRGRMFYGGAKTNDGKVVFVPHEGENIVIFDPDDDSLTTGAAHGEGRFAFRGDGATLSDGRIVFAPYRSDHVGVYDPENDEYESGPMHGEAGDAPRDEAFRGATATRDGDAVVFAPAWSENVTIAEFGNSTPALNDTNGDGIPDAVAEMNLRMPTGGPGIMGTPLNIDPILADTSGDGLADADQVEIEWHVFEEANETKLRARVTNAIAIPGAYDTDGDGLSDHEEVEIWHTDPLLEDTDNDGYIDSVDPDPLVDNSPPDVRLATIMVGEIEVESDLSEYLYVEVRDEADVESVVVNGFYDTESIDGQSYWQESVGTKVEFEGVDVVEDGWEIYFVDIHQHDISNYAWDEPPAFYYLNVTDEQGNVVSFEVERTVGSQMGVTEAVVFALAPTRTGSSQLVQLIRRHPVLFGVSTIAFIALAVTPHTRYELSVSSATDQFHETLELPRVPPTASATTAYTIAGQEIVLHEGYYDERDGAVRGFGLAYIEAVTGLTAEEVVEAVEEAAEEEAEDEADESEVRVRDRFTDFVVKYSDQLKLVLRTVRGHLISAYLEEGEPEDHACPVDELHERMTVTLVRTADGVTEVHGEQFGMDLQVDCPHDSEDWVRDTGGMGDADLTNVNNSVRGDIAETHAGPEFVEERGLEILYLEAPNEQGFDIVAYDDSSDEYHVIEAKFRSTSGSVSNSSVWFDRPDKGPQMTDTWIEATITELIDSSDPELEELGQDLQQAIIQGQVQRELIVIQNDEQNGKTVLRSLTEGDMDINRVHIVKLEKVVT